MLRLLLVSVVILMTSGFAQANPEIHKFKLTEGVFGPERPTAPFVPLEKLTARFYFKGLKRDLEGNWRWLTVSSLRGADGTVVFRDQKEQKGMPDGEFVVQHAELTLPTVQGVFVWTISVKDLLTSEETKIEREIKVAAPHFAVVSPRLFDDRQEEGLGISWHFVPDQYCSVRVLVVGYDWSQGQAHVSVVWRLLDGEGKLLRVLDDVQCDKLEYKEHNTRQLASEPPWVYFRAAFIMPNSKTLTIEVIATDMMTKKTATLRIPVTIHEP
jgi:hypothetical protein